MLATILAGYLAYKASRGAVKGSWQLVAKQLGLGEIAGEAIADQARRALGRLHQRLPKKIAEPLWMHADAGVKAGTEAGFQLLVNILKHTDTIPETTPRDIAEVAEELARTITFATQNGAALAASQPVSTAQGLAAGEAAPPAWMKRWKSRHDLRVRFTHAHLDGVSVPIGQPFVTLDGNDIRYPHDPRAPLSETKGCRCLIDVYPR